MSPADDLPTATLAGLPPTASLDPAAAGDTPADPPARGRDWHPGDAVGRFRLVAKHRPGGIGQVWRAEDPSLRRTAAVKTLRPERGADPGLVRRFVHEARVTGELEHPAVVPVYDLVDDPAGPAYAMRFVAGTTLAEAAAGYHAGRPDPVAFAQLLTQFVAVCQAVAFAHGRGVLHRDLKGQNVVLGEYGEVFLIDWGLAKRAGDPDTPGEPHPLAPHPDAATDPTRTGVVLGTPAYMAPEVASGQRAIVASDVYGLGAVLYHLLTNHTPVPGHGSPQEVLDRLTAGQGPRPVRGLNPAAPPALAAVCHKALARDPAARYPSAQAVAAEVQRWLAGEPVDAYPEPLSARLWRRARRNKAAALAAVAALAVVAVVSSAAAALVYREQGRTERQRQAAVLAGEQEAAARAEAERQAAEAARRKEQAEGNLEIALAVADNLFDLVSAAETGAVSRTVSDRLKLLGEALTAAERLQTLLPDDPARQTRLAKLHRFAGNLARVTNTKEAAERHYAASLAVQRRLVARFPGDPARRVELAYTLDDQATYLAMFGRLTDALAGLDAAAAELAALPAAEADAPAARRALALTLLQRSGVETQLGRGDARGSARRAAELFAAAAAGGGRIAQDPIYHGIALVNLADARREGDGTDLGPAREAADQAVEVLQQATAAPGSHRDAWMNLHLAQVGRARLRRLAGRPGGPAELDEAAAGLRALVKADPGVPVCQQALAAALTERAALVPAAEADPLLRALAEADLAEAVDLLDPLIRAAPDHPGRWWQMAQAWAGLARLAADPARRELCYNRAGSSGRAAKNRSPECRLYEREYAALEAAARQAGHTLGKPKGR